MFAVADSYLKVMEKKRTRTNRTHNFQLNALITLWLYYPQTASPHTTTMFYYPTKWCFYWRHKITIRAAHYYFENGEKVDLYQTVSFPVRLIPFSLRVIYFCVVDRTLRWCRDITIIYKCTPCFVELRFFIEMMTILWQEIINVFIMMRKLVVISLDNYLWLRLTQ